MTFTDALLEDWRVSGWGGTIKHKQKIVWLRMSKCRRDSDHDLQVPFLSGPLLLVQLFADVRCKSSRFFSAKEQFRTSHFLSLAESPFIVHKGQISWTWLWEPRFISRGSNMKMRAELSLAQDIVPSGAVPPLLRTYYPQSYFPPAMDSSQCMQVPAL